MASQTQSSRTPLAIRDLWQTPRFIYNWANKRYGFKLDAAASEANHLSPAFINGDEVNSLTLDWHTLTDGYIWCNPPYSELGLWLAKGWEEAQKGARIVFLVPTPNGENHYRDSVFERASKIIFINGRVAFEAAADFTIPAKKGKRGKKGTPEKHIKKGDRSSGNTRGSCFIIMDRNCKGNVANESIDRDEMKRLDNTELLRLAA